MITAPLLQAIMSYLTTKPYREVHKYIDAVQREVANQKVADQPNEEDKKGDE